MSAYSIDKALAEARTAIEQSHADSYTDPSRLRFEMDITVPDGVNIPVEVVADWDSEVPPGWAIKSIKYVDSFGYKTDIKDLIEQGCIQGAQQQILEECDDR